MPRMKSDSSRTFAWTAGILLVLALVILSPTGAFALLILATLSATIATIFGSRTIRVISVIILVASMTLAAIYYPEFEREHKTYIQRAQEHALEP